ncbi:hypothetical protein NTJ28_000811 [Flavobacterium psychrophilum]|nr:hypothetical protein [Flavobacterium psychrophilum]
MSDIHSIYNQTILVQTTYQPAPHLETELEIMVQLLAQGNTIYWMICNGDFKVCFHNPKHDKKTCLSCHCRVKNGYESLKKNVENYKNLHLLDYKSFLKIDDFNFNNNLIFSSIKDLKSYYYKSYDLGLSISSSLVSFTRDHEPDLKLHDSFIKNGLYTGAFLYDTFQLVLQQIKPDLVILFNGRFIENRPLLRVCQENKVAYATHERGGKLNSYLFRFNSIPHSLATISNEIESLWANAKDDKTQIGKIFYENRIKRVEEAWYSFTKEQQEGKLPESFKNNQGKKIITIFNSSLDEYEGLEGFGPYFYNNDNEGIREICKSLMNFENIKLYLRVHPNLKGLENTQNRELEKINQEFNNLEIIAAADSVDTYALINRSDLIIVFGSTVGVEAAFAGKNVVLLGQAAYQGLKCFVIPKNHEDLISILSDNNFVFPKINHEDTLKYGYWNEKFGIEYKYYDPINLADGLFFGKKIKLSWFQNKVNRYIVKISKLISI